MNPTRGYTSQRTWIYPLVLNTVILSEAWISPVNFRELQRCYLEVKQGLNWEQIDLRAIMKLSPFFDNLKGGPNSQVLAQRWSEHLRGSAALLSAAGPAVSHQRRTLGCRSQAWLCTQFRVALHWAVGAHIRPSWLLQMAPKKPPPK